MSDHNHRPRFHVSQTDVAQYTADELEFMQAMERFQREAHRPFPTLCEYLAVLRSLGYQKVAPPRAPRAPRRKTK